MKIAVCDDEILVGRQLGKIVRSICEKEGPSSEIREAANAQVRADGKGAASAERMSDKKEARAGKVQIRIYTSGAQLLRDIDFYDIVFLDLRMPEMDGIEVGKEILRKNPGCRIIVATGERDRYKEGYVIRAVRFVTKPFEEDEIAEALREASQMWLGEGMVEVYRENKPQLLLQKEICYIVSYDGYVRIYTQQKEYRKEAGLEKMLELLDERLFVRIDRGVIVNLAFVEKYETRYLLLAGEKFKIARRRREEAEKSYIDFKLKYERRMKV